MSTNEVEVVNPDSVVLGTVVTWSGARVTVTLTSETVSFGPGRFSWGASALCRGSHGFSRPNHGLSLDWDVPGETVSADEWAPILAALRARGF